MTIIERDTTAGISFALTEEQRSLRALAREFAEREIRPVAARYDEDGTHPADVIAKAHEVGLMNAHIPEELGGPGLNGFDGMLIGEELAWGCSGIATAIVANTLGAAPVLIAGTEEQKQQWVAPLNEEPMPVLVRADRAERRLRRVGHPDHRRAPWRRVRPQRLEDLHHERRARDVDGRVRLD